jgi:hypothetical protein
MTGELVKYSAACSALAACVRVDEAKGIRDKAEAMRVYAQQANNRELEISAAEIRLRAEYRLGELIKAQKETVGLNAGSRGAGRPVKKGGSAKAAPKDTRPKLADVGISQKLSMRSQRLAGQTPTQFARRLLAWRQQAEASAERVSVDLMRDQDKKAARAKRERVMGGLQLAMPKGKAGVLYVDVPRKFIRHSDVTGMDRAPENHYRTMTFEQLLDLPVPKMTHDDAMIFYWSTAASLLDDLEILADWGFVAFRPRGFDRQDACATQRCQAHRTMAPHNGRPRNTIASNLGQGRDRHRLLGARPHELLLIATKGRPPAPAPARKTTRSSPRRKPSIRRSRIARAS